mgnify:CR=1 FL=1
MHDEFVERLVQLARTAQMGDPMSPQTQVGPITTRPQLQKILDYLEVAKAEGAHAELGGTRSTRPECGSGWFVEPTIFTGARTIGSIGAFNAGAIIRLLWQRKRGTPKCTRAMPALCQIWDLPSWSC